MENFTPNSSFLWSEKRNQFFPTYLPGGINATYFQYKIDCLFALSDNSMSSFPSPKNEHGNITLGTNRYSDNSSSLYQSLDLVMENKQSEACLLKGHPPSVVTSYLGPVNANRVQCNPSISELDLEKELKKVLSRVFYLKEEELGALELGSSSNLEKGELSTFDEKRLKNFVDEKLKIIEDNSFFRKKLLITLKKSSDLNEVVDSAGKNFFTEAGKNLILNEFLKPFKIQTTTVIPYQADSNELGCAEGNYSKVQKKNNKKKLSKMIESSMNSHNVNEQNFIFLENEKDVSTTKTNSQMGGLVVKKVPVASTSTPITSVEESVTFPSAGTCITSDCQASSSDSSVYKRLQDINQCEHLSRTNKIPTIFQQILIGKVRRLEMPNKHKDLNSANKNTSFLQQIPKNLPVREVMVKRIREIEDGFQRTLIRVKERREKSEIPEDDNLHKDEMKNERSQKLDESKRANLPHLLELKRHSDPETAQVDQLELENARVDEAENCKENDMNIILPPPDFSNESRPNESPVVKEKKNFSITSCCQVCGKTLPNVMIISSLCPAKEAEEGSTVCPNCHNLYEHLEKLKEIRKELPRLSASPKNVEKKPKNRKKDSKNPKLAKQKRTGELNNDKVLYFIFI